MPEGQIIKEVAAVVSAAGADNSNENGNSINAVKADINRIGSSKRHKR